MEDDAQPSETIYERMSRLIYAYHFGQIGYLDLLQKLEEMLGIASPQTDNQPTVEVVHP